MLAERHGVFEADFVKKELGKMQELNIAQPYVYLMVMLGVVDLRLH